MGSEVFPPDVSVIIVTHDSAGRIGQCLQSLSRAFRTVRIEVIVVDTGSLDHTLDVIREQGDSARVLRIENRGFATAANAGAARGRGAAFLLLNPDAELPPGGGDQLFRLVRSPRVAAVSGLLVDASGCAESIGEPFPRLSWYIRRRFQTPKHGSPLSGGRVPSSVPWLSGAALMVRREAFQSIGGFRASFFLYYEDIDLCRRLREHGAVLLFDPRIRILHIGGGSAQQRARLRASDNAEDHYFALYRPTAEQWVLRLIRPVMRHALFSMFTVVFGVGLLLGQASFGAVARHLSLEGLPSVALTSALAFTAFVATVRRPDFGAVLLLASVIPGQLVRLPLLGIAEGVTVTDAVLPLVLGAWLLAVLRQRAGLNWTATIVGSLLVPLFALLPGILLAAERLPTTDWLTAGSYALRLLLIFALVPLGQHVLRHPRRVTKALISTATILAFIGVLQFMILPSLEPYVGSSRPCPLPGLCSLTGFDPHSGRLFSTWLDPNLLGGLFVIALGCFFGLTNTPQGKYAVVRKLGILIAAGLVLFALVLTKSRTSLVAALAVIAASVLVTRSWRRVAALLSLGLIGVALVPGLAARFGGLTTGDPTTSLRVESWQQAIEHSTRLPLFGAGYNAYAFEQLAAGNIGDLALHSRAGADNSLLTFLATTGLWGVVLLGGLLSFGLWTLARRAKTGSPTAAPAVLALTGLLVHAQFTHSLVYIHLAVPLALLISVAFHPSSLGRPSPHGRGSVRWRRSADFFKEGGRRASTP